MESTKNIKTSQSQRKQIFYFGVVSIGFIISAFSWWLGFTNFNPDSCQKDDNNCKKQVESLRIVVIPIAVLIIAGSFRGVKGLLNFYVDIIESQLDLEAIQERHRLEREVPSEYRYPIEMDFLSVYYKGNADVPDISYEDFCQKIKGSCDSRGGIKEKTENYVKQGHPETIKEVLEGLDKGFSEDEDGKKPFYQLAKTACNHALKLDLGKFEQWASPFYDDIILYLNAWLVCSVKYGFAIPIRPFYLPLKKLGQEEVELEGRPTIELDDGRLTSHYLGEEAIGHYFEEDSYIKAIQHIQNEILEYPSIREYFGTQKSRDMVKDYLGKLVDLLEDEKKEERAFRYEHLSYVRESGDSL